MLNSETLEVAIGMAFLFLSVALICTAIREWLEGLLKWRAMDLERGLRTLLADPTGALTRQLLGHPLLDSLFAGQYDPTQLRSSWFAPGKGVQHMRLTHRRNLPSYIPATQFAVALLDWVARGPVGSGDDATAAVHPGPLSVAALRQSALCLESPSLQRAVLSALDHSAGDLARARQNVEQWFNGTMDRTSGWYKRRTQAVLFLLGLLVAGAVNIDAFHVMQRLTTDKAFREAVVRQSSDTLAIGAVPTVADAASATQATQTARIANAKQALELVALPIGWRSLTPDSPTPSAHERPNFSWAVPRQLCDADATTPCRLRDIGIGGWFAVIAGWLATAFAVMLGAPFWFDVLNRFMVIRSTVKPHEKSPEESSQDRQSPLADAAASN